MVLAQAAEFLDVSAPARNRLGPEWATDQCWPDKQPRLNIRRNAI